MAHMTYRSNPKKGNARLPQHGGEGVNTYQGNKTDTALPQHGGEGKSIGKGTDMRLLKPTPEYCGPGRYI